MPSSPLPAASDFLACGYWASLVFAIPAAIGAWGGSPNPKVKPLFLLGDGSFLMGANPRASLASDNPFKAAEHVQKE